MDDCSTQVNFLYLVVGAMALGIYGMYEYTKSLKEELRYSRPRRDLFKPTPKAKAEVLSTPCLPEDSCEYVGEHVDPGTYSE